METQEHKRNKPALIYWAALGLGIGFIIGASTHDWVLSMISGIAMGAVMALCATKKGFD